MWLLQCFVFLVVYSQITFAGKYDDISDNEFAEFEDFEAEDDVVISENSAESDFKEASHEALPTVDLDDQEIIIDDDDSEFEHFQDMEEFEGFENKDEKPSIEPKITITKVPIYFRANWDSYWLEILMVAGLVVYFINFILGKTKNTKIANIWLQNHRQLLEDNFALVGDDGAMESSENVGFVKESENIFTLWCSGRTCCEGMLVELKLIKRQDLVSIISRLIQPVPDQVHIKVTMNKEDMDTFVLCVAQRKAAASRSKDMADLSVYCPDRRSGDKHNLPATFSVMSEIPEATSAMLDSRIVQVFTKYKHLIDFIHFSDQFTGAKSQEDTSAMLKQPDNQKVLIFNFNMPMKGMSVEDAVDQLKPLMAMVFYCIEKVKRYRLSKEGKNKADKNRQKVEEAFLKSTHQARAEAAAARREERRRQEKEKVMADEDPERQMRWEEKEQKRQAKKRAPKMKQLKVKAL